MNNQILVDKKKIQEVRQQVESLYQLYIKLGAVTKCVCTHDTQSCNNCDGLDTLLHTKQKSVLSFL